MRTTSALLLCLALVGCGKAPPVVAPTVVTIREPIEVRVPVIERRVPPAELLAPITSPVPVFLAPEVPTASSALDAEGERVLRAWVEELLSRLEAWRAWAEEAP